MIQCKGNQAVMQYVKAQNDGSTGLKVITLDIQNDIGFPGRGLFFIHGILTLLTRGKRSAAGLSGNTMQKF